MCHPFVNIKAQNNNKTFCKYIQMVGVIMFNIKKMFTKNMSGYAKKYAPFEKKKKKNL